MPATDSTAAIEAVFRIEFPRLVAGLTRYVGDIGMAEELAQDALVDALRQWPERRDAPQSGGMADDSRQAQGGGPVSPQPHARARNTPRSAADESRSRTSRSIRSTTVSDDDIADDRLRLIFVACHPVLAVPARVALTLRLLGGLTTAEIARAYLQPEATIAQRIVRAKKTIAKAKVPFEVPAGDELRGRLASVLEVIYLIFNEGYSATAGDDWLRPELCAEALRLGPPRWPGSPRRGRGARLGGADGDPVVASPGPGRTRRRAGPAARPGSPQVGSVAHQSRTRLTATCR